MGYIGSRKGLVFLTGLKTIIMTYIAAMGTWIGASRMVKDRGAFFAAAGTIDGIMSIYFCTKKNRTTGFFAPISMT